MLKEELSVSKEEEEVGGVIIKKSPVHSVEEPTFVNPPVTMKGMIQMTMMMTMIQGEERWRREEKREREKIRKSETGGERRKSRKTTSSERKRGTFRRTSSIRNRVADATIIVLYCIYSASCGAHQSEALPMRETHQREESSLERTKRGTWLIS